MIVSALPVDKNYKPESHLKICLHAAVHAVTDVEEDIPLLPGTIGKVLELSPDGFTTIRAGANPMHSLHAITTPLENMNHVAHPNQHQNAIRTVFQDTPRPLPMINGMLTQFMESHLKLLRSKLKS